MNLRQALTFVTVAELGTVSKAALRLRIAQPALSRQIIDLERELGLRLFDRVGRRLLLTGEGEQMIAGCRVLLNCASSVKEQAQLLRHGDRGVLKVAGSPQHIESVLAQFLLRYAKRYPNVQVKISEGTGSEILTLLERGKSISAKTCCMRSSSRNATSGVSRWGQLNCWRPVILRCSSARIARSR
jgi:DNA-binding transcriptional LysR family regulator